MGGGVLIVLMRLWAGWGVVMLRSEVGEDVGEVRWEENGMLAV